MRGWLLLALGLSACRGVLGIEDFEIADGGAQADGGGGASDGGGDASSDVPANDASADGRPDAKPDGPPPNLAICTTKPLSQCQQCCPTTFPGEWSRLLEKFRNGCICGLPDAALCGPQCGGQEATCPGSPNSGSTPAGCQSCVVQAVTGSDPKCATNVADCEADLGCKLALDCIRGCK